MKRAQILKLYPEYEPWKRAAFLLFHVDMLLFNERMAIGELVTAHHPSVSCYNLINAAFIRNIKLIKGVDLTATSDLPATPQGKQAPEQELTL